MAYAKYQELKINSSTAEQAQDAALGCTVHTGSSAPSERMGSFWLFRHF